jgi:hypothetical protein
MGFEPEFGFEPITAMQARGTKALNSANQQQNESMRQNQNEPNEFEEGWG